VKVADDDLGQLTDVFNEMLSEIERRDEDLLRHRDRLEQEVEDRTADLVKSNTEPAGGKRQGRGGEPGQERVSGQT